MGDRGSLRFSRNITFQFPWKSNFLQKYTKNSHTTYITHFLKILKGKMDLKVWLVGTSNQLFMRGSYTGTRDRSILYSSLAYHREVLYGSCVFNIITFNLKTVLHFFGNGLCFSENLCQSCVLKTSKICSVCHIKTWQSLKRRAISKILSNLCAFCWL